MKILINLVFYGVLPDMKDLVTQMMYLCWSADVHYLVWEMIEWKVNKGGLK